MHVDVARNYETELTKAVGLDYVRGTMVGSLGVRKGAWTEEEDILLRKCVEKHGEGRWHEVPSRAGLNRCRKSCRMRWLNYLKPNIKRGQFSVDEVDLIIRLHKLLGNRWSLIAGRLSGRTANDVKNYWNSNQRKKVVSSTDAVRSKPEAKSITRDNITKPRPWKFRNLFWLGGKSTPLINVGSQHGNDLCKPCYSTVSPPSDINEVESLWWESSLDDKEINQTINSSCLGSAGSAAAAAYLESNESHLVENNEPGGIKTGDVFYEQAGQNCWSDISLDADLWNLINTELDQQQPEKDFNYVRGTMASLLGVRKGAWTEEEDILLRKCVEKYGEGRWHQVPSKTGLNRCRKSCRLRWLNYLKPDIKRGQFSVDEVDLIIRLHKLLGNRQVKMWSLIAGRLPGRTANDVKNYWNTNLRKKVVSSSEDAQTKPEAKSITKDNIIKPRPRNLKNFCWLRAGKGTPYINVASHYGDDLCQPYSSTAFPPSDTDEVERMWWESLLDDKEINLTNSNSSCLGSGFAANQEPVKSLFVEDNAAGGIMIGDPCSTIEFPPSDRDEAERMWWESLLDDKEINLTNSNTTNQEPINSTLFVEDNPAGGIMIGDVLSDQGQNRWVDISFDADLWSLIDTEIDQQ
ncbi:hypothetical protein NC653_038578 [Populus alba x Populus x berolinensis]|uniref:Uncharacterized protein n=1 Tax=Populus alba x Populus x berolinensis TaxID=444605 RepID=A0AAD6LH85_9ROSI|nr:hypothetical protein NC653_038578 [Populus alba x Populus x berolinensis]